MIADFVSYVLAGLMLAFAAYRRKAVFVTLVVCLSLAFDRIMLEETMTYEEAAKWAGTLAVKDFLLGTVICYRAKPVEFFVGLGLMASCFVNYWVKIEAQNEALSLFYHRPDIMSVIVASWFASIALMFSGGSIGGGKRYRRSIHSANSRLSRLLYVPAFRKAFTK